MKTYYSNSIGSLIIWSDYVKPKKHPSTGNITYNQSNTKLEGYSQRYIGLYTAFNGDVYVGIVLNRETNKQSSNSWFKFVIENRILTLIDKKGNVDAEFKGATMVPQNYVELLSTDPYAYSTLYGPLNTDDVQTALRLSLKEKQREVQNRYKQHIRENKEVTSEYEE